VAAELRARLQARGRGRAHTSVPIADTQAAVRSLWYEGARERERERERERGGRRRQRKARPSERHGTAGKQPRPERKAAQTSSQEDGTTERGGEAAAREGGEGEERGERRALATK